MFINQEPEEITSIGIDPGTVRVGIGVVKKNRGELRHVSHSLLPLDASLTGGARLLDLERKLEALLDSVKPDVAGIERLFFSKNKKTALEVGEARGVILKVLAEYGIPVTEYTPPEVKLAITGDGKATKRVVAKMAGKFLNTETKGSIDDATDALAIAIAATQKKIGR